MLSIIRLLVSIFNPVANCNMKRLFVTWLRNERKHTFKSIKQLNERSIKRYSLVNDMLSLYTNCIYCNKAVICNGIIDKMEVHLNNSEVIL